MSCTTWIQRLARVYSSLFLAGVPCPPSQQASTDCANQPWKWTSCKVASNAVEHKQGSIGCQRQARSGGAVRIRAWADPGACAQVGANGLTGGLPAGWGNSHGFQQLVTMNLSHNGLSGPLPATWRKNATNFPSITSVLLFPGARHIALCSRVARCSSSICGSAWVL